MPYLHCPGCRLTIYQAGDEVTFRPRCPRCDAFLSRRPARLFRALPARPGLMDDPRHAVGSGSVLRRAAHR